MQNTYAADIKVGSSGIDRVTIQAKDLYHARIMLESQYGRGNVMNLHQRSN
jgi:hypothetical protein